MAILTAKTLWKRTRSSDKVRHSSDLTPEEQANVKTALHFLKVRLGGPKKLAEAMKALPATVKYAASKKGTVSAGIALRAARVAGVPLEDLLSGAWPRVGECPMCRRCDSSWTLDEKHVKCLQ
jgi:hypothetical protein